MKRILQIISFVGLALTILPAVWVFRGTMSIVDYHRIINLGMILWFGAAVFWIKPSHDN